MLFTLCYDLSSSLLQVFPNTLLVQSRKDLNCAIFIPVKRFQPVYQKLKQNFHFSFVPDNEVNFSVRKDESDTVPCEEW